MLDPTWTPSKGYAHAFALMKGTTMDLPPHSISLGTRKDSTSLVRDEFIRELEDFVDRWKDRGSFAGKTAALRALRRIPNLSALRK